MATLPSANVVLNEAAGAPGGGTDRICIFAPVPLSADAVPRQFGNVSAVYEQHGYAEGIEFAALHLERTGKSILFVGLPIATQGEISREDTSGNTGTSVTSVAAGANGSLTEHGGVLKCKRGGTVGTDQITLELSLDDGRSFKSVRLGTAASYVVPYVGVTISFAAGTLVADDTLHTWFASGPYSDAAGWIAGRVAMAAQGKLNRSFKLIGDLQDSTEAGAWRDQMNAYETANDRFVYGRASVRDRLPLATLGATSVQMTGSPSVTFAEVGATGDTITRSAGSFVSDGFVLGMLLDIAGSTLNDGSTVTGLAGVTATVLTLDTDDLEPEGPVATVTIQGKHSLTFSDSADTIVRTGGSWLTDGFRDGDSITVSNTVSNNVTTAIVTATATTLTVTAAALADEVIAAEDATVTTGQTKASWMADIEAAFASVDGESRVDFSAGRGRVLSPFTAWNFRRPASWAASIREYQHDLHTATWKKKLGPIGFDLYDADGNLVEWDDYVDGGGGTAAKFTTFRSWSNGPEGSFIAQSLTRAEDASLLSRTHNAAVVNLCQTVVQLASENVVIGESLLLKADGTAQADSLAELANQVNDALSQALLSDNQGEGQRASAAVWVPATDDVLNVAEPVLNAVVLLQLRGTIHTVNTVIKLQSGGA